MSIVKEISRLEDTFLSKAMDIYIDACDEVYNQYLSEIETEYNNMYLTLTSKYASHVYMYVKYKFMRESDTISVFDDLVKDSLNSQEVTVIDLFKEFQSMLYDLTKTQKESILVRKRLVVTASKLSKLQHSAIESMVSNFIVIVRELIRELKVYVPVNYSSIQQLDVKDIEDTFEYKNIFSYKELANLAIDNGYEYVRSSGDHRIYKHSKSNRIVVIPAHEMIKSLSLSIQKSIYIRKEES